MAQLVERPHSNAEGVGSNPTAGVQIVQARSGPLALSQVIAAANTSTVMTRHSHGYRLGIPKVQDSEPYWALTSTLVMGLVH